jgi:hypothetical protein
MTEIQFSRPQLQFTLSKAKHPAIIGGFGSGKSQAGSYRLLHLMSQDPGITCAHFFPTYKLAKRRGLVGYEKDLRAMGYSFKTNKSDLSISIPELGLIYLDTYDDPDAIVAFEIAHGIVDELDTKSKDQARLIWQKITERVRQKCKHQAGNTLATVTTPDQGTAGFCYELWGDQQNDPYYECIKASTYSNKFLPEGYVEQIAKNYDSVMLDAFIEGGWVNFTRNKVYHFFNAIKHHTDRQITKDDRFLHVGLDFNIGGCCAVVFIIQDGKPIAVDEFVSHDTFDVCHNIAARYPKDRHKIIIYPDASGKASKTNSTTSDIEILEAAGFDIDAPNTNPAIRDRINAFNGLLSHDKLLINTNICQNLTHSLESQGYDKKGDPEKFNDHPAIDDWVDAAGYFIHQRYQIQKPESSDRRYWK